MFDLKDIINTPIHCPTEEDSILFMKILMEYPEVKWVEGTNISIHHLNRGPGNATCYRLDKKYRLRYGSYSFYEKGAHKDILKLEDIIEPILPKEKRFKLLSKLL